MKPKEIYLAGGCFWGVEEFFSRIDGVLQTYVGYADGKQQRTTYNDLKKTDHSETVYIQYDADKLTLEKLLDYFFLIIDPTSVNRQGNDIGRQYRTAIYYTDERDLDIIQKRVQAEQLKHNKPIVTEVKPINNFCLAEEYHQKYLKKNPGGYCHVDISLLDKIKS
ncbi:MAG: peptide-methionine (S)-S-oxide reductase MsrA [Clostridiales bacterium]|jgi:peptide methionine sulfoxide reductase msrA/msrB|nr:peptide-methionine (S)-S-oxide reductase MsrA [Clostridiales bacterium]